MDSVCYIQCFVQTCYTLLSSQKTSENESLIRIIFIIWEIITNVFFFFWVNGRVITNYTSSSEWVILSCSRTRFTLAIYWAAFCPWKMIDQRVEIRNKVNVNSKLYFLPCCFVISWNQLVKLLIFLSYCLGIFPSRQWLCLDRKILLSGTSRFCTWQRQW